MNPSTLFSKIAICFWILLFPFAVLAQVTIFKETIGSYAGTISNDSYTGWSNGTIYTHSVPVGTASVTNTVSPSNYPAASGGTPVKVNRLSEWIISGINTTNYVGVTLSFGIRKSNAGHAGANMLIEVSSDGSNYTALSWTALPTGAGTGGLWYYRDGGTGVTGDIPSTNNLRIRFRNTNSSFIAYDFDDIELKGVFGLLPLKFINFKAMQNHSSTSFTWTTMDESVIETYELQRSKDGNEFVTVLKHNGAKNLYYQQTYNVEDVHPIQTKAYYRIKAVTQNGKTSFSKIIMVVEKEADERDDLILSATRYELAISDNTNSKERVVYRVISIKGIVVQQGNVQLADNNTVRVPLPSIKPGLYIVSIISNNLRHSQQIFIK